MSHAWPQAFTVFLHSTIRTAGTLLLQIQEMPAVNNSMGMEEVPVSQVRLQP